MNRNHTIFIFDIEYDYQQRHEGELGAYHVEAHQKGQKVIIAPSVEVARAHLASKYEASWCSSKNVKINLVESRKPDAFIEEHTY